ncbi:MAG TPA: SUMF1/EgtB/PvdO family nonheme iron enzyme [Thermotogota bacterium]|nr:SUMF1/EgtB/PvdO family nonheme iron enzyme [Thermotogota bacterium]
MKRMISLFFACVFLLGFLGARDFAILVGIDDYEALVDLRYAEKDARDLAELLEELGFEVHLLTGNDANVPAIRAEIRRLSRLSSEYDLLFFAFSGHGIGGENMEQRGIYTRYMDPNYGDLPYSQQQLLQDLQGFRGDLVVMLDACFQGTVSRRLALVPLIDMQEAIDEGLLEMFIAASTSDQEAMDGASFHGQAIQNGITTYLLLKGIGGREADLNDDGQIFMGELASYIEMQAQSIESSIGQKPRAVVRMARQAFLQNLTPLDTPQPSGPSSPTFYMADWNWNPLQTFSQDHSGIMVVFSYENWTATHTLAEEWFMPSGESFSGPHVHPVGPKENGTMRIGFGFPFYVRPEALQVFLDNPGEWRVNLYFDDKWVDQLSFTFEDKLAIHPENMVKLSRGVFYMGNTRDDSEAESDETRHVVQLEYDFWIGKTEVTFDEYGAFCDWTGFPCPADQGWGRGQAPVINVSWWDAIAFCNWKSMKEGVPIAYDKQGNLLDAEGKVTSDITVVKGYRLPTEAEWEFAARGGHLEMGYDGERQDFKYAGSDTLNEVGWYNWNSGNRAHPVAQKKPNELGLYDMSGNVFEWCNDWYEPFTSEPQWNPVGPETGRMKVLRSGSWYYDAWYCRVSDRSLLAPENKGHYVGFRLAITD